MNLLLLATGLGDEKSCMGLKLRTIHADEN